MHLSCFLDGLIFLDVAVSSAKEKVTPASGLLSVINKYWCWRSKYCHETNIRVCARDRRRNERKYFEDECRVFENNCYNDKDFTITNINECKKSNKKRRKG